MEGTTVNLGSITVVRKNSPLSLELTASFLIDSDTTALGLNQLTATDLFHHSKDGNLWMAKSGSCQLVFKTFINGQLPDSNVIHPPVISSLTGMAAECSVSFGEICQQHWRTPFADLWYLSSGENSVSSLKLNICRFRLVPKRRIKSRRLRIFFATRISPRK